MVDVSKDKRTVTLTVQEYEELLQASGQGTHYIEKPNNDGLRPLEKPTDAGTIGNSGRKQAEKLADGMTPVVKNEGHAPKVVKDGDPLGEFKVEGDTVDSKRGLDQNEYIAGPSMEKVPEVVVDPRTDDLREVEQSRTKGKTTKK